MSATPKVQALGIVLAEVRKAAGCSQQVLADRLGVARSTVTRWESGTRMPSAEDVAQILAALSVPADRVGQIMAMVQTIEEPRWLAVSLPEQNVQLRTMIGIETTATSIVEVSPLVIPGLLQTDAYARVTIEAGDIPPDEVALRLTIRRGRREIIARDDEPVGLRALIGEEALRHVIGGSVVMTGQLRHLRDLAARPNIDIRVVPASSDWHPGLEGAFMVIEAPDGIFVVLENRLTGLVLHRDKEVSVYQRAAGTVQEAAMSEGDSLELIATILDSLGATSEER
jgi:transcriptional regulator with XRE-family HTH domain